MKAPSLILLVSAVGMLLLTGGEALAQDGWEWQFPMPTLTAVSFTDANNGTAVGLGGTILRTTTGGWNWTWVSQPSGTTRNLWGVSFTDANTGTAVGGEGTIGRTNWLWGVTFTDAGTGTAVGGEGTILRTTDGGATWVSQSSGTEYSLDGVCFTDASTGTAVGGGWNSDSGSSVGVILRTTDGGATWVRSWRGAGVHLFAVAFTDNDTGTVVGTEGTILRTTDGGITWVSQSSGTSVMLKGVSFTDANRGTVVGGMGYGGDWGGVILRTTDGGETWLNQWNDETPGFFDVCFTEAYKGTVVGSDGTILRTRTGGVTSVNEDSRADREAPKDFLVEQNYPNPFNPGTTIEFTLPHAGFVTLKVYNVAGQEVATLLEGNHAAGIIKTTWDASGLPSGAYFYRLTAGEYVQTKKAVLMK
jgi:photosystem II stability/assembly factor-like uncharacterized protein